jgi:hypothetical protein
MNLWVDGELELEIHEPGTEPARVVRIGRPFGLIGRNAEVDVRIEDRRVGPRHVYLHLDTRGLFASIWQPGQAAGSGPQARPPDGCSQARRSRSPDTRSLCGRCGSTARS